MKRILTMLEADRAEVLTKGNEVWGVLWVPFTEPVYKRVTGMWKAAQTT